MTDYLYKDSINEWRWRLKSANGNIIADSGEDYKNNLDCLDAIDRVQASANAQVVEE